MTTDRIALHELFEKGSETDPLNGTIGLMVHCLLESEGP